MKTRATGVTSRLTRRFLIFVWGAFLLCAVGAKAEPARTLVQDTLYRADGSVAHGRLTIRWNAFSTGAGEAVAAGEMTVATNASGGISIALIPNVGSTPAGTYYKVVIKLDDGTTSEEQWVVPTASPTTVAAIRAKVVPQAVAVQMAPINLVSPGPIGSSTPSTVNATVVTAQSVTTAKINGLILLDGNTYPYSGAGLQAALTAAGTGGAGGNYYSTTTVMVGPGTLLTNSQIAVPANVVLKGAGMQNTRIKASSSFPTNTPLVMLGCAGSVCETAINGTRVESMTLDCSNIAGCSAGYSKNANENSGFVDVTAYYAPKYGFWLDGTHSGDAGNPTPDHWTLRDVTTCCGTSVDGVYAENAGTGRIENITVNCPGCTNGIEAVTSNVNQTASLQVFQSHVEGGGITNNIYAHCTVSGNCQSDLSVTDANDTGSGTTAVHIGSGIQRANLNGIVTNGTNLLVNDTTGTSIPNMAMLTTYIYLGGGTGVGYDEVWLDNTGLHENGHGVNAGAFNGSSFNVQSGGAINLNGQNLWGYGDNKARLSGNAGGEWDFNYGTAAGPIIDWCGTGTACWKEQLGSTTQSGSGTFGGSVAAGGATCPNGAPVGSVCGQTVSATSDLVSVLSYGAKCDGVTDDSTAIQAAINAAGSPGVVSLPPGKTCLVSGLSALQLTGLEMNGATLQLSVSGGTILTFPNSGQATIGTPRPFVHNGNFSCAEGTPSASGTAVGLEVDNASFQLSTVTAASCDTGVRLYTGQYGEYSSLHVHNDAVGMKVYSSPTAGGGLDNSWYDFVAYNNQVGVIFWNESPYPQNDNNFYTPRFNTNSVAGLASFGNTSNTFPAGINIYGGYPEANASGSPANLTVDGNTVKPASIYAQNTQINSFNFGGDSTPQYLYRLESGSTGYIYNGGGFGNTSGVYGSADSTSQFVLMGDFGGGRGAPINNVTAWPTTFTSGSMSGSPISTVDATVPNALTSNPFVVPFASTTGVVSTQTVSDSLMGNVSQVTYAASVGSVSSNDVLLFSYGFPSVPTTTASDYLLSLLVKSDCGGNASCGITFQSIAPPPSLTYFSYQGLVLTANQWTRVVIKAQNVAAGAGINLAVFPTDASGANVSFTRSEMVALPTGTPATNQVIVHVLRDGAVGSNGYNATVTTIAGGGTGATSASAALTALGAMASAGGTFTGAVTAPGVTVTPVSGQNSAVLNVTANNTGGQTATLNLTGAGGGSNYTGEIIGGNYGGLTLITESGVGTNSPIIFKVAGTQVGQFNNLFQLNYGLQAVGTQTISGCSYSSAVGGQSAGQFKSGTAGTCTVTISLYTSTNGWSCRGNDITNPTDVLHQTAVAANSVTLSGTTASGDVINWDCVAY